MRHIQHILLSILLISAPQLPVFAQQQVDDIVKVNGIRYKILTGNLIPNPGFEEGFTDWTDATTSSEPLSSTNFTLMETGGVDNSKYIVGTKNESSSAAGSIGTGWAIEGGKTYYFSYHVKYQSTTASSAREEYLKISLTNNKSLAAEPFVLLSGTQVNGGGEWTKNEVAFTNSTPYSYIVARFRWLNNRFGFDAFSLHEALELPNIDGLVAAVEEAQAIYDPEAIGAAELLSAITMAQGYLTSESSTEVWEAITALKEAITTYRIDNASPEKPVDMTHFIVNQGFDNNDATGWTGGGTVNYHSNEYYEKTFNLYQHITGLPAGRYTLKAQAFERPKHNDSGVAYKAGTETLYACFYAKSDDFPEKTVSFSSLYRHTYSGSGSSNGYVNTMASAEIMFATPGNYETVLPGILLREGATLTIGARSDFSQGGYWALMDNFRLEYEGYDANSVVDFLNDQIAIALELLTKKMQNSEASKLNSAVEAAQQALAVDPIVQDDLYEANSRLLEAIATATVSVAAYDALQTAVDSALAHYGDGSGNGADILQDAISAAQVVLSSFDISLDEVDQATLAMNDAIFVFRLSNGSGPVPTVVTNPNHARGATVAFGRSTITGVSTSSLLERGFCWSTSPEPTVLDNRSTDYLADNNGRIYRMGNLQPATIYYMRAYAITNEYAVGYGDVVKVITIPKGSINYTVESNVSGDNRTRISAAMKSAVNYWNNLTSIQNHHLSVNYGSGTPTAEASYGGWMRFGPSVSYQQTGTALHEMGHTIGVGQHTYWTNTSSSPLKVNGVWQGERANNVVRFLDNDPSATMKGDGTHMWPYGINGAHEDTGSELLYVGNSLITQGLGEDGLPPTYGFATPAYTFESDEGVKYYIKNEAESRGRNTSFLIENENRQLVYREMTKSEALSNDSTAWYLDFNPATCYYRIRNASTGNYITYKSTGTNGIGTAPRTTPTTLENFQLMGSRSTTQIGNGASAFVTKGYWIVRPEKTLNPPTFAASSNGVTSSSTFNILTSATTQRWFLLTEDEVDLFVQALSPVGLQEVNNSSIRFYTEGGQLYIDQISLPSDISVYDISGRQQLVAKGVSGSWSKELEKGVYVVSLRSQQYYVVKKMIIW